MHGTVITRVRDMVPFVSHVTKGTYDPAVGTFVLLGGSSYKCTEFDTFAVSESDQFYRKFNYEVE